MAVSDAFVACWFQKYRYNLLRPVTYAQAQFDPDWLPLLVTPPFPEYPSGHSVQSGAAFQVLTDLFGRRYEFVDRTHDERGLPARRFDSFLDAGEEAAISACTAASTSAPRSTTASSRAGASVGRQARSASGAPRTAEHRRKGDAATSSPGQLGRPLMLL